MIKRPSTWENGPREARERLERSLNEGLRFDARDHEATRYLLQLLEGEIDARVLAHEGALPPPASDLVQVVATMRRLLAKATPGPWRSLRDGNQRVATRRSPEAPAVGASRIEELPRPWNPDAYAAFGMPAEEHEVSRFLDADADLIVAMRNALPGLLHALEAARSDLDATYVSEQGRIEEVVYVAEQRRIKEVEALKLDVARKDAALRLAKVELDQLTGWSGSAGNWPLQDASAAVDAALREPEPER